MHTPRSTAGRSRSARVPSMLPGEPRPRVRPRTTYTRSHRPSPSAFPLAKGSSRRAGGFGSHRRAAEGHRSTTANGSLRWRFSSPRPGQEVVDVNYGNELDAPRANARAVVVVCSGLPGTGKSRLAEGIGRG